ncbi:MAG: CE1759 family FMN reductase, partial [Nakamurella sp.]
MTHIAVISAGMGNPSATRLLADRLADTVVAQLAVADAAGATGDDGSGESTAVDVIELRELAHPLADNLLTGFPSGPLATAFDAVEAADALIVVTPVFAASYSGLFKMFFDVLEPELLRGKPVLLAATAGTARHSLVLEHALRPLLNYLGAVTAPTAVFAAAEDW